MLCLSVINARTVAGYEKGGEEEEEEEEEGGGGDSGVEGRCLSWK